MQDVLQKELGTSHLEIINESHMHNVPKEAETHFKIVVVSPQFEGVTRVRREQKVLCTTTIHLYLLTYWLLLKSCTKNIQRRKC
jgi:stress-induced morphogen